MKKALFTMIALTALLLAGCSGDDDISGISESAQAADLTTLPTETELQSELGLSETQTEAMAVLLADWRHGLESEQISEILVSVNPFFKKQVKAASIICFWRTGDFICVDLIFFIIRMIF